MGGRGTTARRLFAVITLAVAVAVLSAPLFRRPSPVAPGVAGDHVTRHDTGGTGDTTARDDTGGTVHGAGGHRGPDPLTTAVLGANVLLLAGIAIRETVHVVRRRPRAEAAPEVHSGSRPTDSGAGKRNLREVHPQDRS